jgi:toxin YhaV
LTINGWTIIAHPLFLGQLAKLTKAVEAAKKKDPKNFRSTANAKLLAQIAEIAFRRIPQNPEDKRYRQGETLGPEHKHWFREKFGNGRFRFFFRYDKRSKILIYAWVNDETTLRTYGAKSDAYAVFAGMLKSGNPPDDWNALNAACSGSDLPATCFSSGHDCR